MQLLQAAVVLGAAFAVACTNDTFAEADANASDAAVETTADAAGPDVGEIDSAPQNGDDGCVVVRYFEDHDGDGWGGTVTTSACAPPDGTWVTKGGDCDDSNPDVHPGQAQFFSSGYVPTGKTEVSFDWDCDGQETESGSPAHASCVVVTLQCVGDGYLPSTSRGAGTDAYCGSDQTVTCGYVSLVCKASAPATAAPIACH